MSAKKRKSTRPGTIALNKKARHEYFIEDRFEAGVALMGWEVKSLRAGKCQLVDSYVLLKDGEAFLLGARIEPMSSASSHVRTDTTRTRKLLLTRRELGKIYGAVQKQGYTAICTAMYWKKHLVKCEIALARGKKQHDKRASEKERDWSRQKQRVLRRSG